MRSILARAWKLIKQNMVLVKFYSLLVYLWILFYFFLHWKVTTDYIATYLPIIMAKSVASMLTLLGFPSVTNGASVTIESTFSFAIIYQCAGIFGMMIYSAAVIAFPSTIKEKLWGLLIGIPGLYVVNTIRMIALGIIGVYWNELFDWFHEWMWQGIFIIFVIFFWLVWKEKFVKSGQGSLEQEATTP